MEAMAPDEMDQDHGQKSGREELEDTVQDHIRVKEHEIRKSRVEIGELGTKEHEIIELRGEIGANEQEIKGVEKNIANASETEVRQPLEAKLQFLRQQICNRDQQIISLRQEISNRDQQINNRDQHMISLRQEISSLRSVQKTHASAELPFSVETMKKLLEDAFTKYGRDSTGKLSVSMSSITTEVAENVLKMAGINVVDGSAIEPAGEVSISKEWEFDMGQYAREEDCYEPFFKHMVKYLNIVHAVNIQNDPPYPRGDGCCRLLDVHELKNGLDLEAELDDGTLKITCNLDAVFVPLRRGTVQYRNFTVGGVKVKHVTEHKEIFKHGAPTVGIVESGGYVVLDQALMEALAVYAYSDFRECIFLLTSYDENVVMELKDREIWCWTGLNFAQAMHKIATFLKGEDVQKFLKESDKPAKSREEPHISKSKRYVRKKLKIGGTWK